MAKDLLTRKCSHCGHNGHNSRTCNGKGCLKLFGVKIEKPDDNSITKGESIRRSKSAGNLQSLAAEFRAAATSGYHSDAEDRRKGKVWTEEEHRSFLLGLEKLGKGDWRGISKSYVPTRTSTQVASHAQKYFIRRTTLERKKRRSSVFDIGIKNANADSTSPEDPSNDFDHESLALLNSSNQAMIPFENLAHEKKIEASTHVVASAERPPLIPSMKYKGSFGYPTIPYMIGSASSSRPAFSFHPMMHFPVPAPNSVYLPSAYNNDNIALPLMVAPLPHQPKPPTPMATSTNKSDGLDLSLGSLSL